MANDDISRYVVKHPTSGIYRYYRRVPIEVAPLDRRVHVKQSLKTKNHKEALSRAEDVHQALETLWKALLHGEGKESSVARYEAALKAAQSLGFTYKPAADVGEADLVEFERRIAVAEDAFGQSETIVDAVMGTADEPAPTLNDVWTLYEEHNEAGMTGMSPDQLRKHKNSRLRAIEYAKSQLGEDMELGRIVRADILRYRSWWTQKVKTENLKAYTANRSFSDMLGMLTVIDEALHTNYKEVWTKSRIKETNANKLDKRRPFSVDWIQSKILAPDALQTMNLDARCIVYIMIETGMRLGEVCNLRPQDIVLNDEVPHLEVAERTDRRQKTEYSIRRIPLVGVALWAAKQYPEGFPRYQDKADVASALINKMMKKEELRPTRLHTLYSFRHTFQDRIENAGVSDRMQADLMGHEFGRPVYGDGSEMERRRALLESIKFEWEELELARD
ncbi:MULTISPECIES: site-specific integrase [unclassified Rhizobium]|uniref:site-specific integrase n=1 Tax=unclassified Rhizobium TaxID=2613769 RepID=UPI00146EBFB4|nr:MULTISPECIES: site-specific integrase [unclassified Rhizobium]MBD9445733.1 tyrosine-type recombinase/integrase [Rhizobium sp. RHZ01]NMN73832.1 site-specific recombinase XerD [Rhizobium sp. 57MFTsu3.2]